MDTFFLAGGAVSAWATDHLIERKPRYGGKILIA
jgi:hypothetical protein